MAWTTFFIQGSVAYIVYAYFEKAKKGSQRFIPVCPIYRPIEAVVPSRFWHTYNGSIVIMSRCMLEN